MSVVKPRYIHVKSKGLIRELIQKLFLKILSKIFPKRFSSYKNKIRFIMNKNAFFLYLYSASIYLKFKHPRYFNLPARQIYAMHVATKFLEILKPQKIDLFLVGGCLLGAVRQGSFAGRPTDIDLGIKEEQLPKLLDAIPLLKKTGSKFIRKYFYSKLEKIQFLFPCMLIDVGVYRKVNVNGKEMWTQKHERAYDQKYCSFSFSLDRLVPIEVYGKQFLAPCNPEIYLEKYYGKKWRIPDHNKWQYFWNKNKINE